MFPSKAGVFRAASVAFCALALTACARPLQSELKAANKWSTGFWVWNAYDRPVVQAAVRPDSIYVQAGEIEGQRAYGNLPRNLPVAKEYWLVFRANARVAPDPNDADAVAQGIRELLQEARSNQIPAAGVQLDIDSPTRQLDVYAGFLRKLRNALPADTRISITALLDWFRDGTDIGEVIRQVDEFVPQFYDVAPEDERKAIAVAVDAKWAPRFNRFGKPYRIGISTFGRARIEVHGRDSGFYRDLRPADFAGESGFRLSVSHNAIGELVLRYTAIRSFRKGYLDFNSSDYAEFIMATNDQIKAAVGQVRAMGEYCKGVVFFRWPARDEVLAMDPDEVLRAAGMPGPENQRRVDIRVTDGHCAAVSCSDLFLLNRNPLLSRAVRYRVRSSDAMEYFVPADNSSARLVNPTEIEVPVPAYGGVGRMYLGRAVSAEARTFRIGPE